MNVLTAAVTITARTSVGADTLTEIVLRAFADLAVREDGGVPADGRDEDEAAAGFAAVYGALHALTRGPEAGPWVHGAEAEQTFLMQAEAAYRAAANGVAPSDCRLSWPDWLPYNEVMPLRLIVDLGQLRGAVAAKLDRSWAKAAADHGCENGACP